MKLPGHSNPCLCSACRQGAEKRTPLLQLVDVSFERENRVILDSVDFTVDRGDFIAITGPNGGGKTTLLRIILGLLEPTNGRVVHFDEEGRPSASHFAPGYLPQKNSVDSHFPISVKEVIASGLLSLKGLDKAQKEEKIYRALDLVGLRELASRPIGRLSGGQLQRTLFGRAIVAEPSVLIFDEPLSYIDVHFEERMYEIIAELSRNSTILLVSHQMTQIGAMANRHIIVDHALRECTHAHHYVAPEC